jgi:dCTP deaminase
MILSDREIQAALRRGAIRITPQPPDLWSQPEAGQKSPWSSTTLDLRLDAELTVWKKQAAESDVLFEPPDDPQFDFDRLVAEYAERHVIPGDGYYAMRRGDFVLGWTLERIQLPATSRLAARVEGKSSLARLGIGIHVTAPTIHAGFGVKVNDPSYVGSAIRLEIFHHGEYPVKLKAGMKICQLVFEEVHGTPEKGYEHYGRFAVQGAQPLPPS